VDVCLTDRPVRRGINQDSKARCIAKPSFNVLSVAEQKANPGRCWRAAHVLGARRHIDSAVIVARATNRALGV
jgi:hypothetical protein